MKRVLALVLAILMATVLVSCGKEKAFDKSKIAFQKTTEAYLLVNDFSSKIYEAWYVGVNLKNNYDEDRDLSSFAGRLGLELSDMKDAIASLLHKEGGYRNGDWELLIGRYGSFSSACVFLVAEVYEMNGESEKISNLLIEAKDEMKELSDKYSDYENYSSLKTYFTNTVAFFDFCKNPEGSFEQVVETMNNYRNTARACFFDLNYIFEDSIEGMYAEE